MAVCWGWPKLSSQMVSKTRCSGDALPQSPAAWDKFSRRTTWLGLSNPDLEGLRKTNELAAARVQPAWGRDFVRNCYGGLWPGSICTVVILLRTNTYLTGRLGLPWRCLIFTTLCRCLGQWQSVGGGPNCPLRWFPKPGALGTHFLRARRLETNSLEEQLDSDWAIRIWRASGRSMSWLQPESSLPEVGILPGIAMGDCGPVASGTVVILLRTNTCWTGRPGLPWRCLTFSQLCVTAWANGSLLGVAQTVLSDGFQNQVLWGRVSSEPGGLRQRTGTAFCCSDRW